MNTYLLTLQFLAVGLAGCGTQHARISDSELSAFKKCATPIQTIAAAKNCFVSQWGYTPSNLPPESIGPIPWGYNDSGPTAMLMAMMLTGQTERPAPQNAFIAIDRVRDVMIGYDTTGSQVMTGKVFYQGIRNLGAKVYYGETLDELDATIATPNASVVINSVTSWGLWGKTLYAEGNYLNKSNPRGNSLVVMAKLSDNRYIIADTLFANEPIIIARDQLNQAIGDGYSFFKIFFNKENQTHQ